jgi:hypothetical protein
MRRDLRFALKSLKLALNTTCGIDAHFTALQPKSGNKGQFSFALARQLDFQIRHHPQPSSWNDIAHTNSASYCLDPKTIHDRRDEGSHDRLALPALNVLRQNIGSLLEVCHSVAFRTVEILCGNSGWLRPISVCNRAPAHFREIHL